MRRSSKRSRSTPSPRSSERPCTKGGHFAGRSARSLRWPPSSANQSFVRMRSAGRPIWSLFLPASSGAVQRVLVSSKLIKARLAELAATLLMLEEGTRPVARVSGELHDRFIVARSHCKSLAPRLTRDRDRRGPYGRWTSWVRAHHQSKTCQIEVDSGQLLLGSPDHGAVPVLMCRLRPAIAGRWSKAASYGRTGQGRHAKLEPASRPSSPQCRSACIAHVLDLDSCGHDCRGVRNRER